MFDQSSFDAQLWCEALMKGDRLVLSRAITLVESTNPEHRSCARELLSLLLPRRHFYKPTTIKLAISGAPGAGKSTLIEALGSQWLKKGHHVAVLSVDPSSHIGGGSVLADKTRMPELTAHERGFIRPSPSSGVLGGVTQRTREVMILLEVAGFDRLILETVGVGQSESQCVHMVDQLCLLQLPKTGDELQALKKGVHEYADILCVHKADDPQASEVREALSIWNQTFPTDQTSVMAVSSRRKEDVLKLLHEIELRHAQQIKDNTLFDKRSTQMGFWYKEECRKIMAEVCEEVLELVDEQADDPSSMLLPSLEAWNTCLPLKEALLEEAQDSEPLCLDW